MAEQIDQKGYDGHKKKRLIRSLAMAKVIDSRYQRGQSVSRDSTMEEMRGNGWTD